jgi:Metallo-peptidase family M12B Reprolysin-like
LIAYTPRARAEVGGAAQIERLIRLAVSETNVVYANSGVHQRMRLVGIAEAPYDEARVTDLLGALRDPDDGIMDELHALRDRYGADLVSMVTDGSEGNGFGCGVGFVTRATPADAVRAFSLVRASCLVNYWTLAHETGHNMGLCHETADLTCGVAPYARSYADPEARFYTMMSYGCVELVKCQKIPHYSNPMVTYRGRPTGVPGLADEARALNEVSQVVAAWRPTARTHQVYLPLLSGSATLGIETVGSAGDEEAVTVSLAVLSDHQLVTAVRSPAGDSSVTVWQVMPNGQLITAGRRRGEGVSAIAVTALSSERFAVAEGVLSSRRVRTSVWTALPNGDLEPLSGAVETSVLTPTLVSATGLSPSRFVTAARRGDIGRPVMTVWTVSDTGLLERRGSALGEASDTVSVATVGPDRIASAGRDDEDGASLSVRFWDVAADHSLTHQTRINHSTIEGAVVSGLSGGRFVTASRDGNDVLKLMIFYDAGGGVPYQQGIAYARSTGQLAIAQYGGEQLATATRSESGALKLTLWEVAAEGAVAQRGSAVTGSLNPESDIALGWLDSSRLVTAMISNEGRLSLTVWHIRQAL